MFRSISQWLKKFQGSVLLVVSMLLALLVLLLTFLGYTYKLDWTGLNEYSLPNQLYQRGKTLWDWLNLMIVPLMLSIIGIAINQTQKNIEERRAQREKAIADVRVKSETDMQLSNQYDAILTEYLDRVANLLIAGDFSDQETAGKRTSLIRARTLVVLQRLDIDAERNKDRKGHVIQMLYETGLIKGDPSLVSLEGANLVKASLHEAELREVNLRGVRLCNADMIGANLSKAILREADLEGAKIRDADLTWADLRGTNMDQAELNNSKLIGSNLNNAKLRNARLADAKLNDATLEDATLFCADLHHADLSHADLRNANLSQAKLTQEQWEKAANLQGTILPSST